MSSILDQFKSTLGRCKRQNHAGQTFYNRLKIIDWMKETSPGCKFPNFQRLFDEVNVKARDPFPMDSAALQSSLIVFAILLDMGQGHLITKFNTSGMTDDNVLKRPLQHLSGILARQNVSDHKKIIETFEEKMWQFHPATLQRDMYEYYTGKRWILPFCREQKVDKSGMAKVRRVRVQEEFVPPELKSLIDFSKCQDKDYGLCYKMAIKSYPEGPRSHDFDAEANAFRGMKDIDGIVKYLGTYIYEDAGGRTTHNILLECGEQDLDDFLYCNEPPTLGVEINKFYEDFFTVAKIISRLHHVDYKLDVGRGIQVHGFHGDIKPHNILRVNGRYKLADFGFAAFAKEGDGEPAQLTIRGGTQSYSAPEFDRTQQRKDTLTAQKMDTWSFGCVLSEVASWVVLGQQGGYERYRLSRVDAHKGLHDSPSSTAYSDSFHDGSRRLPWIKEWHDMLRHSVRISDSMTGPLLDLVEQHMLRDSPADRITFEDLCQKLDYIKSHAQVTASLSESFLKQLLNLERTISAIGDESREWDELPDAHLPMRMATEAYISRNARSERVVKSQLVPVLGRLEAVKSVLVGKEPSAPTDPTPSETSQSGGSPREPGQVPMISVPGSSQGNQNTSSTMPTNVTQAGTSTGSSPHQAFGGKMRPNVGNLDQNAAAVPDAAEIPDRPELPSSNSDVNDYSTTDETSGANPPAAREVESEWTPGPSNLQPQLHRNSLSRRSSFGPCEIEREYNELDKISNRGLSWDAFLGIPRKDKSYEHLKRFLVDRDIIFLVDDSRSMVTDCWDPAKKVLVTLATKVVPHDKDGLDLVFKHFSDKDSHKIKQKNISTALPSAMKAVQRLSWEDHGVRRDMPAALGKIFDQYLESRIKKRTTLIVLTDGDWTGVTENQDVETKISGFLKQLEKTLKKLEDRWFSIQFVGLGDEEMHGQLKALDDDMAEKYGIRDVIDYEHWRGSIDKMITGSISNESDLRSPSTGNLEVPSASATPERQPSISRTSSRSKRHTLNFSGLSKFSRR